MLDVVIQSSLHTLSNGCVETMQLKNYIPFLVALSSSVCYAASSTYDGRPGCKTPGEIGHVFRNFLDPMRYWRCIGLNMEALSETCPDVTGFQQSLGRCVPWRYWKWEIPVYPPSCPTGISCIHMNFTPSSLYPQTLYPQVSSHAFMPTEPYSQPQPPLQSYYVGPLTPQSYLPSQSSPISNSALPAHTFVPSQSPQIWNTPHPLVPSQIFNPSLASYTLKPSQSPQIFNPSLPSYTLEPSQSPQIFNPSLPSYTLEPSQSPQIFNPSLPSQMLVPPQSPHIVNPSLPSQTLLPSPSPQIQTAPYPWNPSLPQYPGGPIA